MNLRKWFVRCEDHIIENEQSVRCLKRIYHKKPEHIGHLRMSFLLWTRFDNGNTQGIEITKV